MSMPMRLVILWMWLTEDGSMSLSGTFFCVTQVTESFPRMAMLVSPADLAALKAYSVMGDKEIEGLSMEGS